MKRRWLGAVIVALWLGALVLLWRRNTGESPASRLAAAAAHVAPATYYYALFQNGRQIGVASSAVDTSTRTMRVTDVLSARTIVYGDSQAVAVSSTAYLTRGFALDSFALALGGDQGPLSLRGVPKGRDGVLLPSLAPMALMLSGAPKIGRSGTYWIYNPLAQRVERTTLTIRAESLLSLVDSARFDDAARSWVAAHSDTVRAWAISTPTAAVNAWVDAEGRVVAASEPGGVSMMRTTYKMASPSPRRSDAPATSRGSVPKVSTTRGSTPSPARQVAQ